MAGTTGDGHAGRMWAGAVGVVLAVVAMAALVGFLAGAVLGGDGVDVSSGLLLAASFVLLSAVAAVLWWRWASRRAAKLGMSTRRYLRVARQIQRGEVPDDPAELPAAMEIAARARRTSDAQQRRLMWWLMGGVALLWLTSAVIQIANRDYVRAFQYLGLAGIFLINPLTLRRQRRRLDAVEQALSRRTSASAGGAEQEGQVCSSDK